MPCSDGGPSYYEDTRRLDAATRAACEAITALQNTPMFPQLSVETRAWWSQHQREDAVRIAREQEEERRRKAKEEAWNKLTDEERRLLGVWR